MDPSGGKNPGGIQDFMVESLKELNARCQKPQYKEVGNWMVRKILRPAALPVTWLLLHTPITANQVTLISLLTGLLGIFFCAFRSNGLYLAGMLLVQLWYLLDHVDGQIARYRGTSCLTGRFFDFFMHHVLHGVFFFAIGCHAYLVSGHFFFAVWGFVTAFSMTCFNLLHDIKYKTWFEYLGGFPGAGGVKTAEAPAQAAPRELSLKQKAFALLHKSIEMHVIMNIFTLSAILDFFLKWNTRPALFFFYALAVPFCLIMKTTFWIVSRKIDREFQDLGWKK